ncbi:hypothetical protein ACQPW1_08350 [Nocardia sp. CA-128927]|uniref:hypothetical protein n=1 Tax=Nocardia sp. CA-128927 TaxID=3239975 RepID=UPI003D97A553
MDRDPGLRRRPRPPGTVTHRTGRCPAVALTQQLQFGLVGVARTGIDSATEDPKWTGAHWPTHAATAHLGYDLLAAYWELPPGALLADPDRWDAAFDALTPISDTR